MQPDVELGDRVKDAVSGYSGIAVGKASYLGGREQIAVQASVADGKLPEAEWLPRNRLVVLEKGAVKVPG